MNSNEAKKLFEDTESRLNPSCPIPMNKQKDDKKAPAYLTGLVNMIIEENIEGNACDYDPRKLTTLTKNNKPIRTLARRVDGICPCAIDIKIPFIQHNHAAFFDRKNLIKTHKK